MREYTTIDLFAGIGGIRRGFDKAGFKTIFAADLDSACKITYDSNYKLNTPLTIQSVTDIDTSTLDDFDILLGGFPCQSFSQAGRKAGFADKGRGDLIFDITRILKAKKPRAVFLENVKHLVGHDGGKTFRIILDELNAAGYYVKAEVLNSSEYGNVPQNRERVYIVGFRDIHAYEAFNFPKPRILTKTLSDILDTEVPEKYYHRSGWLYDRIKDAGMRQGAVYQWRRWYLRENKSGCCFTLTANMGTGGHNVPLINDGKGLRKLTPRECARLQGFPDSYKLPSDLADTKLYKQIGNSVTVSVIERVAKKMKIALEATTEFLPNDGYIFKGKAERHNVAHSLTEHQS